MNVNYIKHLETVTLRMSNDKRLKSSHVSMYLALFLIWNHNRFQNPISINRSEVMKISRIGARATYHKCITELHQWDYLNYFPSHDPLIGSVIDMFNFDTSSEQVVSQVPVQLSGQVPRQVLGPSINNIKHNKQIKQLNINKDDSKIVLPEKSKKIKFSSPSLAEAILFFKEKNKSDLEAERFFNHYESNGWLVGGKSKMKNWQAAARNWILNSEKFQSQKKESSPGNLNVNQNKDYSIPL